MEEVGRERWMKIVGRVSEMHVNEIMVAIAKALD